MTGLPTGLTGKISGNQQTSGDTSVEISGTPTQAGLFALSITLTDRQSRVKSVPYVLYIGPLSTTGIVARYDFFGDTLDRSGNGHDADLINGSISSWVTDRNGNGGGAISLGGHAYIQLHDESVFDLTDYAVVMNMTLPPVRYVDDWMIVKGPADVDTSNFGVRRSSGLDGVGFFGHRTASASFLSVFADDPFPVNQSFCWAVSVGQGSADTYLNGVLQLHQSNVPPPVLNNEPVRIGVGGYSAPNSYMTGIVDDITIFKGALTQAQVQAACL